MGHEDHDHEHPHDHDHPHRHATAHEHAHGAHSPRRRLAKGEGKAKLLFLDAPSGLAGDMIIAALVDLGVPTEHLVELWDSLPLGGYHVHFANKVFFCVLMYEIMRVNSVFSLNVSVSGWIQALFCVFG